VFADRDRSKEMRKADKVQYKKDQMGQDEKLKEDRIRTDRTE